MKVTLRKLMKVEKTYKAKEILKCKKTYEG